MSDFEVLAAQKYKNTWKYGHFLCCVHSDHIIHVVDLDYVDEVKFIDIEIHNNSVIGYITGGDRMTFCMDVFESIRGNFGCIGMIKDGVFTHSSQIYYKIKYNIFTREVETQSVPRTIIINNQILDLKKSGYVCVFEITLTKIQSVDVINGQYYCIDYDFTLIDNWLIAADGRRFRLMGMALNCAHLANPVEKIDLQKLVPTSLPSSLIVDNLADYVEIFEVNNIWIGRVDGSFIQALTVRSANAGKNTKPFIT